jgi:hypothetical protein
MTPMTNDTSEPVLAEYADNPFISALPPMVTQKAHYQRLRLAPLFDEKERFYPAYLRKHCIARLADCFLPQARQVVLADRFDLLLRRGYVGRNPAKHDYIHVLHNGLDRIEAGSLEAIVKHPVRNTANSFSLLGCPGVGKTIAMNRVLAQYPQVIRHDSPFSVAQVVWLRLEAPALGSLRQLCIDFFDAIDRLLGTDYVKRYATGRTVDQMVLHMAHVAHLHALGALIIDEIQHLEDAVLRADALMKFLVRLVNTIGLPTIVIGTSAGLSILQKTFSQARRAAGLGSMFWDRMVPGEEWNSFLKGLWSYQWTNPATDLMQELNEVMYDETQGVADLAVKLFMLVQLRVVSASEVRRNQPEALTSSLFRRVAKEEFELVRPMIEALRKNDKNALAMFQDIKLLGDHIKTVITTTTSSEKPVVHAGATETPSPATVAEQEDLVPLLVMTLERMGIARDIASVTVQKAMAENTTGDPMALLQHVTASLKARPAKQGRTKPKAPEIDTLPTDDLRRLTGEGRQIGISAYDALFKAGMVRPPLHDFGGATC